MTSGPHEYMDPNCNRAYWHPARCVYCLCQGLLQLQPMEYNPGHVSLGDSSSARVLIMDLSLVGISREFLAPLLMWLRPVRTVAVRRVYADCAGPSFSPSLPSSSPHFFTAALTCSQTATGFVCVCRILTGRGDFHL